MELPIELPVSHRKLTVVLDLIPDPVKLFATLPAKLHELPEQLSVSPPVASTAPVGSNVSVCHTRRIVMLPVATNV